MAVLNLETATTFWQSRKHKMAVTEDGKGAELPRLLMVGVLLLHGPTNPLPDMAKYSCRGIKQPTIGAVDILGSLHEATVTNHAHLHAGPVLLNLSSSFQIWKSSSSLVWHITKTEIWECNKLAQYE